MQHRPRLLIHAGVFVLGTFLLGDTRPAAAQGAPSATASSPESLIAAQNQQMVLAVERDPAGAAGAIVSRWESAAMASGKWDENFAKDLFGALVKLPPANLLAALQAQSYESVASVVASGKPLDPAGLSGPQQLGDTAVDLVYTPIAPCRIVDTRNAGGPFAAGATRDFDVDGSTFTAQGGNPTSCGIPFGPARAVAMNITVTGAEGFGWVTAWQVGAAMPNASLLNYTTGWTIANSTIVPVVPGAGNDFRVNVAGAGTHVIIDVLGYYAAPAATPLQCTQVASAVVAVPVNAWTNVDVSCPGGYTATGGGFLPAEGTLGWPGMWTASLPNGNGWRTWVDNQTGGPRSLSTYASCCRVPGR